MELVQNAQNFILNLVVYNFLTDPHLEFWIRLVSRSGFGSGSGGSVTALVHVHSCRQQILSSQAAGWQPAQIQALRLRYDETIIYLKLTLKVLHKIHIETHVNCVVQDL